MVQWLRIHLTVQSIANTLAIWCEELIYWKRPWSWVRLKAGGEGDARGWDDWMASPTRWTWVWVSSRSWWMTGKPGMLQSMGLQRVRHNWVTELNWTGLTMQGTLVWSLLREDHTCHGATKLLGYNYWAYTLEPKNCNYRAHWPQLLNPCCATGEAKGVRNPHSTAGE